MSAFFSSMTKEKATRWVICFLLLSFTLYLFSPFIAPIIMSAVIAFSIEPSLSHKHRRFASFSVLALVMILVAIPIAFFFWMFYSELSAISHQGLNQSDTYQIVTHYRHSVVNFLSSAFDHIPGWEPAQVSARLDRLLDKTYALLSVSAPVALAAVPFVMLSFLVFNLLLFMFLLKAQSIKRLFLKSHLLPQDEMKYMITALKQSCRAAVISTLFTGFMHAFIFTLGSMIFKIGTPLIVFPLTLLCSFLPVIGTMPVALTLIFLGTVNHQFGGVIGILSIGVLSFCLDHLIRVYWMVNATHKIHPIISFVGILGAFLHYGLTGVIYGPLLISLSAMIIPTFLAKQKQYEAASQRKSRKEAMKSPAAHA